MPKLTKRQKADLELLIEHTRTDISYDAGGSFGLNPGIDEEVDAEAVKSAVRAINLIKQLIYA